jgi:hypothetical protein
MARAGATVATIARTDIAEIELALPARESGFVKSGMDALVTVDQHAEPIKGSVHRISDILDERMQTVAAFVRVKNAARQGVKSGAYATVQLDGKPLDNAFEMSRKAIHDKNRVYVIEKGKLAEKEIDIAYMGISKAYVQGGIDDGAVLIAEPLQDAVIGMAVQSAETARRAAQKKAAPPEQHAEKAKAGRNRK